MKFATTSAVLALASTVFSVAVPELEKRATCTAFGFTYACIGSGTTSTKAATTTARTTTPATTTAQPTTTGGASTGGKSAYTSGSSATDIDNNTGCTALTVILARGTTEQGNIGSVTGPPLFKQLLTDLGASKLTLQGVNYAADAAGNTNCGTAGSQEMADEVNTISARCPNTKITLVGYSQGGCVVHKAASISGISAKTSAVVIFGDPFNGQKVGTVPSANVLEVCGSSDSICASGPSNVSGSHTSYGSDAAMAATFIENTTGVH